MEALLRPWRDDLAAIVARGVEEGAFVPPDAIDDFTLWFVALLDGLALQRLRQLHQLSRKSVIELAMNAAAPNWPRAPRTPDHSWTTRPGGDHGSPYPHWSDPAPAAGHLRRSTQV